MNGWLFRAEITSKSGEGCLGAGPDVEEEGQCTSLPLHVPPVNGLLTVIQEAQCGGSFQESKATKKFEPWLRVY